MNSYPPNLEDLQDRLVKLEKQNRRFKQVGVVGLLGVVLVLVMGQAPEKKIVEANEFILKDSSGRVRATLSEDEKLKTPTVQLTLFNVDGSEAVSVDSGFQGLGGGTISVFGDDDGARATMMPRHLSISDNAVAGMMLTRDGLVLRDSQGFESALGVVDLWAPRTAESHWTSAASLVLLDKDKNVIWKAP